MLRLSGFELYSRWVPLMRYRTDINLKSTEAGLFGKKKKGCDLYYLLKTGH